MEQFKKNMKITNVFTAIGCVVLLVFVILGFAAEFGLVALTPMTGDSHWHSQWRGFISGAATGVLALMVFFLVRSIRALKDEKKLKKLYIQETDERMVKIWTAARAASTQAFLLLGLVACIVAGYFSIAVSVTIVACTLVNALLAVMFKLYYSRKF